MTLEHWNRLFLYFRLKQETKFGQCIQIEIQRITGNQKTYNSLITLISRGPRGKSVCEKMLFTSEARAPYMQMIESRASMATAKHQSQDYCDYFQ